MPREEVESPTCRVEAECSVQLSYQGINESGAVTGKLNPDFTIDNRAVRPLHYNGKRKCTETIVQELPGNESSFIVRHVSFRLRLSTLQNALSQGAALMIQPLSWSRLYTSVSWFRLPIIGRLTANVASRSGNFCASHAMWDEIDYD